MAIGGGRVGRRSQGGKAGAAAGEEPGGHAHGGCVPGLRLLRSWRLLHAQRQADHALRLQRRLVRLQGAQKIWAPIHAHARHHRRHHARRYQAPHAHLHGPPKINKGCPKSCSLCLEQRMQSYDTRAGACIPAVPPLFQVQAWGDIFACNRSTQSAGCMIQGPR